MRKIILTSLLMGLGFSANAQYDGNVIVNFDAPISSALQEQYFISEKVTIESTTKSIGFPRQCFVNYQKNPNFLPTIPENPNASVDFVSKNSQEGNMALWRTSCGGQNVMILTITPKNPVEGVYFCDSGIASRRLTFTQGDISSFFSTPICGTIKKPSSFILYADKLDINQSFRLFYDYEGQLSIDIPAATDTESGAEIISKVAGLWYDPALNGLGFNFVQTPYGNFIYYYGYAANGERLWLMSNNMPSTLSKGQTYEIEMVEGYPGNGANFNTKPSVSSGVAPWGSLSLTLNNCSSGSATLRGKDGIQPFALQKLADISGATCID